MSSSCTFKVRKFLQNPPESPWFDWIATRTKRFEGRLLKDDWANLCVNDVIVFYDPEQRELACRIIGLHRFESFGSAFDTLGSALVPIEGATRESVEKTYRQYYKDEDVKLYGVIAIELDPLSDTSNIST